MAAHAHPARSIKWALQAGAYSIEHGTFLDDECCDLMSERDAFLVPTLNVYKTLAGSTQWPHLRERAAFLYEHKVETFRRAAQRGVKWAVGSDTSMFLPIENFHQELKTVSDALEIDPPAVLQAATKGNATLLGLDRLGEIAPGYLADLIVVDDGDPTHDLAALEEVRYTIAAGRLIDWAAFENAMGPRWFDRHGGA